MEQPLQELSTADDNAEGPETRQASVLQEKGGEHRAEQGESHNLGPLQAQQAAASPAKLFAQGGHEVTSVVAEDAIDSDDDAAMDKLPASHANQRKASSTPYTELD